MVCSEVLPLNMVYSCGVVVVERKGHLIIVVIKLVAEVENKTQQDDPEPVADEEDNPEQITSVEDADNLHEDYDGNQEKQL